MFKVLKFNRILIVLSILYISLQGMVYAVDFDSRDKRVDLPVLSMPNNAITPRMSVSESGHVYVIWNDNRRGSPTISSNTFFPDQGWLPLAIPVTTGFPRPEGGQIGDATSPQVCSDNYGHVYAVWVDDRAVKGGTGKRDIYFRYSNNYGATWYPEFIDERIDTDNPSGGDSIDPEMTCDENGNVYIVWADDRNGAGIYEIYFRSLQVQFNKPVDFLVYYQTPDLRLNTGGPAGMYSAFHPSISTDKNGHVYVGWQDNRNIPEENTYPGIYFNSSGNHGATWLSTASRIDRAPLGGFISFSPPSIRSDSSGHVYAAWLDNAGRAARGEIYAADGSMDVYFNRSSDFGVTWDEEDKYLEMGDVSAEVGSVAIANNDKGVVIVAWTDNSGAGKWTTSPNYNVYTNHSEDFGRSFLDSEANLRIDAGIAAGITVAASPVVRVDNLGNVFAAWTDIRTENSVNHNIYFNFSAGKGRRGTWQDYDMKLDYPTPPGDSISPVMAIDNHGHVYVAWQDSRSALAKDNYNIYFVSGFLDRETLQIAGQRIGESCFIATAAYGSPYERHVELLRGFRDGYLMTNSPGRWFVSLYYRISPPVANLIIKHSYLRPAVRGALLPVVGIAALFVYTTPLQKIAVALSIIIVIGGSSFIIRCIMKSKINHL